MTVALTVAVLVCLAERQCPLHANSLQSDPKAAHTTSVAGRLTIGMTIGHEVLVLWVAHAGQPAEEHRRAVDGRKKKMPRRASAASTLL